MEEGTGYSEPSSAPPPAAAPPPVAPKSKAAIPALVIAVIALAIALIGIVAFPGPTGPAGAEGAEGAQGQEGDEGDRGPTGPAGATGATGANGTACWDLNENGQKDVATEDINGDLVVDVLDCTGAQGPPGPAGPAGADGADGADGLACWDLNGNGIGDVPAEDINGDLVVDVLDCTGAQGPQGIQGIQGPPGPPGTPATVLWAVVESDGTLARGSNVVGSQQIITGRYTVTFNQNVRQCAYIATQGLTGSSGMAPPGIMTVVGSGASTDAVWLNSYDENGVEVDRSFHLAVFC